MMRSCHTRTTYKKDSCTENWVESFFRVAPDKEPGTHFDYDTGASHTLAALVEKITGGKLIDFLRERILKYIGFSREAYILSDPFGTSIGGSGLFATSRDLMRLLYLYANNGRTVCVDGIERELIPSRYVVRATTKLSATADTAKFPLISQGYGMQLWHDNHGGFFFYGLYGQFGFCFPKEGEAPLLVVTTAHIEPATENQTLYDIIVKHLL